MTTRREHLSPEVRARTILADCAHARLTAMDEPQPGPGGTAPVGLLADDTGAVHLVVSPGAVAPQGRFRITCRAGARGLGVLRLEGRCGRPACPEQPAVAHLLASHRSGSLPGTGLTTDEPIVLTLELDAVTVLTPATDTRRAGVAPVDLRAWATAAPDAWILEVDDARARLEGDAQDHLRALVAGRVPSFAEAVAVVDLSPTGLELACLSRDGVTSVTVPFDGELDHPDEVAAHIRQLARPTR